MLRNERYYDVPKDVIGRVSGDIILYSEIVNLVCGDIFAGLLHDLF